MPSRIKPVWGGARVTAPAWPVVCTPGDNLAVHVSVITAPVGSVLVVDVGDERDLGYWGEVLTTAAEARGIVGLVIDGCVRDVAALEIHGFPVFSTGIALAGATKTRPGAVGGRRFIAGIEVVAGDWVVGHVDGVVLVDAVRPVEILEAGRTPAAAEHELFTALRAGETTVARLGLDPSLVEVAT